MKITTTTTAAAAATTTTTTNKQQQKSIGTRGDLDRFRILKNAFNAGCLEVTAANCLCWSGVIGLDWGGICLLISWSRFFFLSFIVMVIVVVVCVGSLEVLSAKFAFALRRWTGGVYEVTKQGRGRGEGDPGWIAG
ncbi:hypothetical protein VTH06DRAFT_4132 [Thermothelomyces fergusii]